MSAIKKYAEMVQSRWGSGEFGGKDRPDPFSVLSDETRMAIVALLSLKGPMTAKQIASELGLSPSTVLGHLKKLLHSMVVREVEVAGKAYKRERYYDVDVVPYFEEEEREIERRISKYADILSETFEAAFRKCLDELADYKELLMARHGMTWDRDDVRHFIWMKLMHMIESHFLERGIYRGPLETEKRWFLYIKLKGGGCEAERRNAEPKP